MANKEISELTAGTAPDGAELLHGVQSGNSRKFTVDQLRGFPAGQTSALAQGDILYVNGSDEIVRLPKGSAGQLLRQNDGLTAPEWASPPFSAKYKSPEQTFSSGTLITLTHGLGGVPELVTAELVCVTGELGYSAGDRVVHPLHVIPISGVGFFGIGCYKTSTTLGVRPATVQIMQKGAVDINSLTPANWRLVVIAAL